MAILGKIANFQEIKRFARFVIVGTAGTIMDIGGLWLLLSLGWATLPANTLAYSLSLANNYFWHAHWTFADLSFEQRWRRALQFVLVSLIGLALNNVMVVMLADPLGSLIHDPVWKYMPAKVLATACGGLWNFFGNRYWTFGDVQRRGGWRSRGCGH